MITYVLILKFLRQKRSKIFFHGFMYTNSCMRSTHCVHCTHGGHSLYTHGQQSALIVHDVDVIGLRETETYFLFFGKIHRPTITSRSVLANPMKTGRVELFVSVSHYRYDY